MKPMLTENELKGIAMAAIVDKYDKLLYQERIKAKKLAQKAEAFMSTIPIDNGNWYLVGFTEAVEELKKEIAEYNKTQP